MSRTYEQTHPWITFKVRFEDIDYYKNWMLLGEARSKCAHIAGAPLLPDVAEKMHQIHLAKGALATTAIEGNTLTIEEVNQLIEGKLRLPPSKEYLGQEIENIVAACNEIGRRALNERAAVLTPVLVKELNAWVLAKLPLNEGVVPGVVRQHSVGVGGYRGAPAEDAEYLLTKMCDWLNGFTIEGLDRLVVGILKAIFAHLYLAWIHPFGDGNGRTARLLEFYLLLGAGAPTAAAHLLSNHYNQTRTEYYRFLDLSHKKPEGPSLFLGYALQGFVDGLHEQIAFIKVQQKFVHWRNYVYDRFRDQDTKEARRKRRLVFDLTGEPGETPVIPLHQLRYVSPHVAEAYAGLSDKTLERDIQDLVEMGLLVKHPAGVQANLNLVEAFLPRAVLPEN